MAAYPSISVTASLEPFASQRVDVSDSGSVRIVSLGESTAVRIALVHPYVTPAGKATLLAFYAANKTAAITIDIHGVTYEAYFSSPYSFNFDNGVYSQAAVSLIGNAQ